MKTNCEMCSYYVYDEDEDCYICSVSLDEDDYIRFMQKSFYNCPYYRAYDEYKIVRKQN